jgi:hypothetical protein
VYYRSDWPELGLSDPLSSDTSCLESGDWRGGATSNWNWISKPADFETTLYGIPVWNLHLEIEGSAGGSQAKGMSNARLCVIVKDSLQQFLAQAPWSNAYVVAKVTQHGPLFQALTGAGFEQVEHRCIYKSKLGMLPGSQKSINKSVHYQSLAAIAANQRDRVRDEILEICSECFQRGYSRHFTDRFLLQRASGLAYILEVMKLNFKQLPMHLFLLAQEADSGRLCGFSILSERAGLAKPYYTQLLSGVRRAYRGQGIYAGLAQLSTEILPNGTMLLNITHADNHAMRQAYKNTGRLHYADTVVLRRIFDSNP